MNRQLAWRDRGSRVVVKKAVEKVDKSKKTQKAPATKKPLKSKAKSGAVKKAAGSKAAKPKKPVKAKTNSKAKKPVAKKAAKSAEKESVVVGRTGVDLAFIGSREESAESRNAASRARVRSELDTQVEEFLRSGGNIENIEPNVMADPPRKPESNYGSRPI